MSRVGNKIIPIPAGTTVNVAKDNLVTVKGAKGTLEYAFNKDMIINVEESTVTIKRPSEAKHHKQLHGTTRALIANMVEGVSNGFKKELQIEGIGYRAALTNGEVVLNVGFSHQVRLPVEQGLTVTVPTQTEIIVEGIDKQRVGEFAANIRAVRKPEPYKGKGIRYKGEKIIRKEGKTAGKK